MDFMHNSVTIKPERTRLIKLFTKKLLYLNCIDETTVPLYHLWIYIIEWYDGRTINPEGNISRSHLDSFRMIQCYNTIPQ